jgi:hypothetical protein
MQALKAKVLNQLTRIKIEQILGREAGLVKDISYSNFLKEMALENKTRSERLAKHEVIFGPQQFDAKTFYHYLFNKMDSDLRRTLGETRLSPSDQVLTAYYDKQKEERFKNPDTIKVKKIYVNYTSDPDPDTGLLSEQQAWEEITRIGDRLQSHAADSFEEVSRDVAAGKYGSYAGDAAQVLQPGSRRDDLESRESLLNIAERLAPGDISKPFKEADAHCFSIVTVTDKIVNGYQKFEDVKELVKVLYADQQYEDFIKSKVDNAHVVIHHDVYDHLRME